MATITPNLKLIKPSQTDTVNIDDLNSNFEKIDNMFPIGYIYMSTVNTNPQTFFGGTWEKIEGKFLLGASAEYPVGSTGGEATHTLTKAEMPEHGNHLYTDDGGSYSPIGHGNAKGKYLTDSQFNNYREIGRGWSLFAGHEVYPTGAMQGENSPHNNMPPYLAVYMWQRIA